MDIIKSAQEKQDIAKEFLDDYIYAVEKIDKEERKIPSKSFKPSSLACSRGAVIQALGIEPDEPKNTHNIIDICKNGTNTHLQIQEVVDKMISQKLDWKFCDVGSYVKENNINLSIISDMNKESGEYETKLFSEKYNIRFLCDGLLQHNKKYYILEIKTISSRQFWNLKDVLEKHKQQAISYCCLLHIDSVIFLYQERDIMNKKTFLFTPTQKEKENWVKRLEYLNDCVNKKYIPEKPKEADSKFCQYCNYKTYCKQIGKKGYNYDAN